MKNTITLLFVFVLSFKTVHSQETKDISNDSIQKSLTEIKKVTDAVKNLKVSGWIQAQFQWTDTAGAKNFDGGDFPANSDNRFMIRRGRIKFTYTGKNSQYVFQLNATERGVNIADIFAKYTDPWKHAFSITAGVMNRPFGYEIQQSSADRESPERSRFSQNFLPNERDIGAMLTFEPKGKELKGLKVDAGFYNGTGIAVPGTGIPAGSIAASGITGVNGFTDFDRFKDFMGHASFYRSIKDSRIKYGIGLSNYYGGFAYQNNKVYNSIKTDTAGNKVWVMADTLSHSYKGTLAPRIYYGVEGLISVSSVIGTTTLRGEYFTGTQTAKDNDTRSPAFLPSSTSPMYVRNFSAGYVYFIQRILKSRHEIAVKYEWLDPNTKINAGDLNGINGMKEGEIKYTMLGMGYNFYLDTNVKFMVHYNMVTNEITKITGYSRDLKDNVLTVRMQYRF